MIRAARAHVLAMASLCAGMLIAGAVMAPAARAEAAYRYWSYWSVRDGAWAFATVGPASALPKDGDVEGWRFVVTTAQGTAEDAPRPAAASAFDDVCGATAPVAGSKRVAVVIDFGLAEHAPSGESAPDTRSECVVADEGATGAQILSSLADIRADDGLVCGIAGYPASECAVVVESTAPAPTAGPGSEPAAANTAAPSGEPAAAPTDEPTDEPAAAPALAGAPALLVSGALLLVAAIAGALIWKRRTP